MEHICRRFRCWILSHFWYPSHWSSSVLPPKFPATNLRVRRIIIGNLFTATTNYSVILYVLGPLRLPTLEDKKQNKTNTHFNSKDLKTVPFSMLRLLTFIICCPLNLGWGVPFRISQDTGLGIIKLSTPNFLRTVENCIREGSVGWWVSWKQKDYPPGN